MIVYETPLKVAYSPCPNDTFIYYAWAHGLIRDARPIEVTLADIDTTNMWAMDAQNPYDLLKISYAALPYVLKHYRLLPCGGALGSGCGPMLLTNKQISHVRYRIAIPSEHSTAFLLLRLWLSEQGVQCDDFVMMPFAQIMPAIARGEVAAGLVIHEARFTYPSFGLEMEVDLGEWWEQTTGQLIPLGAIVAKRDLEQQPLIEWIRQSLRYAQLHPDACTPYIMCHAQELAEDVARAHIQLYVNEYSLDIGEQGRHAIEYLYERAIAQQLIPSFDFSLLR